jgi:hypothetical protein
LKIKFGIFENKIISFENKNVIEPEYGASFNRGTKKTLGFLAFF